MIQNQVLHGHALPNTTGARRYPAQLEDSIQLQESALFVLVRSRLPCVDGGLVHLLFPPTRGASTPDTSSEPR